MIDFHGLPADRLENDHVMLDYLTHAGPRIVRLIPKRLGENLLAELPGVSLPSPYGPYHLFGGHRLWHAPETAARTYVPDDEGVQEDKLRDGVRLTYDERYTGIRKTLTVTLAADEPRVHLVHRLTNDSLWPVELAPWAITQMRIGGTVVLPTPVGPLDAEGLLPNRKLVLWPYSRWDDPRLRLTETAVEVSAEAIDAPIKVGLMNRDGWMEYRYAGVVFRKRWAPLPDLPHPDLGCNCETYTNASNIELETLGPLVRLEPGASVDHVEEWEIEDVHG